MSLSSLTTRGGPYTGNGVTTVFSYGCRIYSESELLVTKRLIASPYTETVLVITTDYTVGSVGASTGNITLVVALPATHKLFIRRVRPLTQTLSIRNEGPFYASSHETAYDKLVMQVQQLQDQLDRCIMLPETVTSDVFSPDIPIGIMNSENKQLIINDAGTGLSLEEPADSMYMGTATSHSVTDGQSATALTGQTINSATYLGAVYQYQIIRGTTVFSTGTFSMHYRDSTWYLVLGEERYDNVSHGVTFSYTGTTTAQLTAALDSGAGNGTIKLKRHLFDA